MSVPPIVREVIARVSSERGVSEAEILSRCGINHVVSARHEAIRQLAAERPQWSSVRIGKMFDRDHSTVLYILGRLQGRKEQVRERIARIRGAS